MMETKFKMINVQTTALLYQLKLKLKNKSQQLQQSNQLGK